MAGRLCEIMSISLLVFLGGAQSYTNRTLGSSLVADATNSSWLSPSAEFAFGFKQLTPNGGYLLAIWFDRIPEQTIIWSANRDNLAPERSMLQLTPDGRLQLNNPSGQQIWASSSSGSYAAMLDTGNLVLADATSAILWQSFGQPTDTLVPTQILNQGGQLISRLSDTNYTRGRFIFRLQGDGNLVWYVRNFPMDDVIDQPYLETKTADSGYQFIFNQSGYVNLVMENGTVLSHLFDNIGPSTEQYYQRLTMDYDGVLRHYVYPKSGNWSGGRDMAWSIYAFLPSNICNQILVKDSKGGGACGVNSYCSMQADNSPQCDCPPSYSLIDPTDSRSGCKPDFVRQSCDRDDLFTLSELPNTDWPFADYSHFTSMTLESCRRDCLSDCLCDVAIYGDSECWKKRFPLSNGKTDPSLPKTALIKIRRGGNGSVMNPPSPSNRHNRSALIVPGSILLGSSVFVNILLVASLLFFLRHFNQRKSTPTMAGTGKSSSVNLRWFSFKELQEATNGFRQELGNGAYSTVFKGTLLDDNENGMKAVAVKRLDRIVLEADKEFKAEVSSISRTNHRNLVQLLGYCDEGQHRLLVYEFMSNGSLADILFQNSSSSKKPSLYTRVQIAFAVARGLCYLHEECSTQIIHCDIKPQNVLLDDSYTAKISDFGLAKLMRAEQTRTTTGIRGTRGYVAPEWFRNVAITVKVDVYSYGIVLLELLCCRKNYEPDIEDEGKQILSDWAYDCCNGGRIDLLVGEDGEMADDVRRFEKMVKIALWCIQEDPGLRPQMRRVVHMLEGSVEVPPPPDPAALI